MANYVDIYVFEDFLSIKIKFFDFDHFCGPSVHTFFDTLICVEKAMHCGGLCDVV